jgi:hypothetical protein
MGEMGYANVFRNNQKAVNLQGKKPRFAAVAL